MRSGIAGGFAALQLEPKNADVNFRIAESLAQEGKLADAAFFYRESSRRDPKRTDAMMAEAKIVLFDDTALTAVELAPQDPMSYKAVQLKQNFPEAEQARHELEAAKTSATSQSG